jgi:uncharacterized protein YjdB
MPFSIKILDAKLGGEIPHMKKKFLLLFPLAASLMLAGCGSTASTSDSKTTTSTSQSASASSSQSDSASASDSTSTDTTPKVTSVTVSAEGSATSVNVGATLQLNAVVVGTNNPAQTVVWSIDHSDIATISDAGLVTGVKAGTVVVTAASTVDSTKTGKLTLEVKEDSKGIAAINASGDYDVKAVIAAVTTKGFVLDDGTGSIFVYKTLDSTFKLGDYVSTKLTVAPYFAIWEGTDAASMAKAEGTAPSIQSKVALTSAMVDEWVSKPGAKSETTAPIATKDVHPVSFSARAIVDTNGSYFNLDGSTVNLMSKDPTEDIKFTNGVKYNIVAYTGGYNSYNKYVSLYIASSVPVYDAVTSLTVKNADTEVTTLAMNVGAADVNLTAEVLPATANPEVVWSEDKSGAVITVAGGVVHAVAAGTATITVKTVGLTAESAVITKTISVTVSELVKPTSITLAGKNSIGVGESTTLTPTYAPVGAAEGLTWVSSAEAVATVADGVVKGVAAGTATITATSTIDTTVKATFAITVINSSTKTIAIAATGFKAASDNLTATLTSAPVTLTLAKGSSSTDLRLSDSDQLRIYLKAELTVDLGTNVITALSYTCTESKYVSPLVGATFTGGTAAANGLVVSVTPTPGVTKIKFVTTAQTRINQIVVTYTPAA